ncbi:MAG: glycine/betaine/sarcosine/D-proline family reductase selenoprotein B [SAR202 cluster bacterium]|jgi:glycine reductase|nr:glycine/betaine/sarcosine/D-proline family reductase selenoprotein B [Chloroflexota bacterium]MQG56866.1 glycine/betaine/sarcosine/D-proline family reductase selenoprotein B [SAR202 cluster bacterium]MQG69888.1 glycine/betaine/sarcosine/D-proline family reductase selenoprotein B [SAR202 cluster bacterium]HAL47074.1 glycine/betaine/sarcosine/D-proline family reductase selenoprotein B [Dehalococcoidia bacterium]|tara:strand:- start:5146 stop:6195 length:1050 start_codon:yes stop_codon:yes gene_type:complete
MAALKVVHYMNQFFAGIGGEEVADAAPGSMQGPVGPGIALARALREDAEIVGTVYCGDNRMAEDGGSVVDELVKLVGEFAPDVVIAGPAFGSGRYGLACGRLCAAVQETLRLPTVMGVHVDSPAIEANRGVVRMVPTSETAVGMADALSALAKMAVKLASNDHLGSAYEEGYIPTGRRQNRFSDQTAAKRATGMLLRKLRGEDHLTEWPLPQYDRVAPAPPLADPANATIALVTEGGIVLKGNPSRLESGWASKWLMYDIGGEGAMSSEKYQSIHGGFDTTAASAEPNRMVPLDTARDLEHEGVIGRLHDALLTTTGNMGPLSSFKQYGEEMAAELLRAKVDGVVLTAT